MATQAANHSTTVGLFETHDHAERAVRALRESGVHHDHVSVVGGQHGTDGEALHSDVATGATTGTVLGGSLGLLVGLGLLAVPGVGPVLAAGPLVAALGSAAAGAGIGAAAGGLLVGLSELGVDEDDARAYEEGVRRGHVMVVARTPREGASGAATAMDTHALDLDDRRRAWGLDAPSGTGRSAAVGGAYHGESAPGPRVSAMDAADATAAGLPGGSGAPMGARAGGAGTGMGAGSGGLDRGGLAGGAGVGSGMGLTSEAGASAATTGTGMGRAGGAGSIAGMHGGVASTSGPVEAASPGAASDMMPGSTRGAGLGVADEGNMPYVPTEIDAAARSMTGRRARTYDPSI